MEFTFFSIASNTPPIRIFIWIFSHITSPFQFCAIFTSISTAGRMSASNGFYCVGLGPEIWASQNCWIVIFRYIYLICKCNIVVLLTKKIVRFKISFAHISDFKMTCTCTTCVFIHRTLPEHLSGVGSDGGRHLLRQLARRTLHLR